MKNDFKLPNLRQAQKRGPYTAPIVRVEGLTDSQRLIGQGLFYHIFTYGCQGNVRDGETMAGILEEMGYVYTEEEALADIILLNTCAIRDNAEKRVLGEIGRLTLYKRNKPNLIIGLCGCMAQEEATVNKILQSYPIVDLVFGTHNIYQLPALIENVVTNKKRSIEVYSIQGSVYEGLPFRRSSKHKAFVSIMEGCDKFCTYCIVPYTRGQQRSRLAADVLFEVNELVRQGYKEVTLIGQNVNAYGKDLVNSDDFATLLGQVSDTGIERVRFTTSHPWDFTDTMIDMIGNRSNIMPFIHLPLQSGNDQILKMMGRRYSSADYLELFDKIKNKVDDCAISTDIIVGFPNETEEQFQDTLKVVEHCKYDNAYSFIFSPREGTPAARMSDATLMEDKKDRLYRLNERLGVYSKMHNQERVGKIEKVLVDGPSKTNPLIKSGYTEQQKLVNFKSINANVGDIINVEITEGMKNSLNGIEVQNPKE